MEAWEKHGRAGPFDWWLGCEKHGVILEEWCMSCAIANQFNKKLQERMDREGNAQLKPISNV